MSMSEDLIKAIHARPALWNAKHPQAKSKHIVKALWEEVQSLIPHCSVEELKRKWKNLKDNYRKEIKKAIKMGVPDGIASPWQYYNPMSFMRDQISHSDQASTAQVDVQSASVDGAPIDVEEESNDSDTKDDKDDPSQMLTSKKRTLNTNEMRNEYLEIEKKKLKMLETELSKSQNNDELAKSDDYHFLMSLLPQMERLEPIQKLRVRNKFNMVLIEELTALGNSHENVTDTYIKVEPYP